MKGFIKRLLREGLLDEEDYMGEHKAPSSENGYPITDLNECYGDEVYSHQCERLFGTREGFDAESCSIIRSVKGEPNAKIKVYRAVPDSKNDVTIDEGNWVTISEKYAKAHGNSRLKGKYKIISKVVKAGDLYSECNSIHEWGYSSIK